MADSVPGSLHEVRLLSAKSATYPGSPDRSGLVFPTAGTRIPNARDTCSQSVGNTPVPSSRTDYRHFSRNPSRLFLMTGSRWADGVSALTNPADGRE